MDRWRSVGQAWVRQKLFGHKNFLVKKNFGQKNFFGLKIFLYQKKNVLIFW